MAKKRILTLHWKLFFPLIGVLWLIIGITIYYFVSHEKHRQRVNLENRLLNVNNTVIAAYEQGADLQKTVDFIRLFTDNTTLAPLRITVYDYKGKMVADNPAATIAVYDDEGKLNPDFYNLLYTDRASYLHDDIIDAKKSMISAKKSTDGKISSFAALPYEGEVTDFLSIDPMIWLVVIFLGIVSSALAYLGVRAVCRNVYALRDFAKAISSDDIPDDIESWQFTKDELGDVSRNLLTLYRNKIKAEQEKIYHERQIGINISHELNTPVGIIKGYLDTAIDSDDIPEDMRLKFLRRAQDNTNRLSNLIKAITTVMRLNEGNMIADSTVINIHKVISQLADDIKLSHIADNMVFQYNVPDECLIKGNESLLTTALLNLGQNAAIHSKGTLMSLNVENVENGFYVCTFSDNGIGVENEHIDRLFDLFYRVYPGRSRKSGGAGIGLPLVKKIIKSMGGDISVENRAEGGLRFRFTIPQA